VVIAAGNSDVKDRVADGRVDVGLMDEDDAVVADAGKPFIEFLVSAEAERILAESDAAQYPLHSGAAD
jgi:ABC-type Fe3+ transport system substrate-binding protein